jgi:hypothetical protein
MMSLLSAESAPALLSVLAEEADYSLSDFFGCPASEIV